jgi:hypothetical protein
VIVRRSAPSIRIWALAAVEVVGALILARIMLRTDPPANQHGHHDMPMPARADPDAAWTWPVQLSAAVAVVAAIWWFARRNAAAAVVCAIAMTTCAASQPVRVLATQSHLIAMVVLEVLMVLVPLSLLTVLPPVSSSTRTSSRGWSSLAIASALAYAALLIVIHVPAAHHRGAELGAAPLWVTLVAPLIGIGYWYGVLRTAAAVPTRTRRAVLLTAQEVAAFVGLLSLFGAWGATIHRTPIEIPDAWDQRLGGLVMMATCAAVAIPIVRRIDASAAR